MKPVGQAPKGSEHQGMNRLLNHIRGNAIAYLALFVALGGTGYAAVNLPANSVGNRQIRNGAITPVKLDRQLVSGSVRAWAEVSATGRVLAGEGSPSVVVQKGQGSTGHYTVSWKVASLKRCVATGGIPRHRRHLDLLVADQTAGVFEGVRIGDAGQEELGPVVVEHGRRPGAVPAPDLRQVLPHRDDLDPV